jgi:sigma-E factor negative regulatory protein RseA
MHEDINEKISRLIDGDLEYAETLGLLKKIQEDESLRLKMCRYQSISQSVKVDAYFQVNSDFSRKVFQEIQQEPTYFHPQLIKSQSETHPQDQQKQAIGKWLAVAASTIAAAVLVGQGMRNDQATINSQTIMAMTKPQLSLPSAYPQTQNIKPANRRPLNAQFNDYLQAHNNSVYTNGEAEFQPYARVASFGRE